MKKRAKRNIIHDTVKYTEKWIVYCSDGKLLKDENGVVYFPKEHSNGVDVLCQTINGTKKLICNEY